MFLWNCLTASCNLYSTSTHPIPQKERDERLMFQAAFGMTFTWQVKPESFWSFVLTCCNSIAPVSPQPCDRAIWNADERTSLPGMIFLMLATVKWQRPPYARRQGWGWYLWKQSLWSDKLSWYDFHFPLQLSSLWVGNFKAKFLRN